MQLTRRYLHEAGQHLRGAELLVERDHRLANQARHLLLLGFADLRRAHETMQQKLTLPKYLEEELRRPRDAQGAAVEDTLVSLTHELDVARSIYRLLRRQDKAPWYTEIYPLLVRYRLAVVAMMLLLTAASAWFVVQSYQARVWHYAFFVNPNVDGPYARDGWSNRVFFDWGITRPAPGIPDANFSMKLTSCLRITKDNTPVEFSVGSDDGSRLYLNGELLLEQWQQQPFRSKRARRTLSRGDYFVRIDYYDAGGPAALTGLISVDGSPLDHMTKRHFRRATAAERDAVSCQL